VVRGWTRASAGTWFPLGSCSDSDPREVLSSPGVDRPGSSREQRVSATSGPCFATMRPLFRQGRSRSAQREWPQHPDRHLIA
jgi:hypothetical protein